VLGAFDLASSTPGDAVQAQLRDQRAQLSRITILPGVQRKSRRHLFEDSASRRPRSNRPYCNACSMAAMNGLLG